MGAHESQRGSRHDARSTMRWQPAGLVCDCSAALRGPKSKIRGFTTYRDLRTRRTLTALMGDDSPFAFRLPPSVFRLRGKAIVPFSSSYGCQNNSLRWFDPTKATCQCTLRTTVSRYLVSVSRCFAVNRRRRVTD